MFDPEVPNRHKGQSVINQQNPDCSQSNTQGPINPELDEVRFRGSELNDFAMDEDESGVATSINHATMYQTAAPPNYMSVFPGPIWPVGGEWNYSRYPVKDPVYPPNVLHIIHPECYQYSPRAEVDRDIEEHRKFVNMMQQQFLHQGAYLPYADSQYQHASTFPTLQFTNYSQENRLHNQQDTLDKKLSRSQTKEDIIGGEENPSDMSEEKSEESSFRSGKEASDSSQSGEPDASSRTCTATRVKRKTLGMRPFECKICGMTFRKSNHRKAHYSVHTFEKPHECDTCGRRFLRKKGLKSHEKSHKIWKCEDCKCSFTFRELQTHPCYAEKERKLSATKTRKDAKQSVENDACRTNDLPSVQQQFQCGVCNQECPNLIALQEHQLMHNKSAANGKNEFCEICPATFTTTGSLSRHTSEHSEDGRCFTCNICYKSFKRKAHKVEHYKNVHNNGKCFTCDICGEEFIFYFRYKHHSKSHKVCDNVDKESKSSKLNTEKQEAP